MVQSAEPGDVTRLLQAWSLGDRAASDELIALVYSELRSIAARHLRRERRDHTLQPTALVNEAYLKLAGQHGVRWANRSQFFGLAAQAMRRILVDHARTRLAKKRGGDGVSIVVIGQSGLDPQLIESVASSDGDVDAATLVDIDAALVELAALDPELVRVVDLRFFGGLTVEETADAMGLSPATVKRHWTIARAWLLQRLGRPA